MNLKSECHNSYESNLALTISNKVKYVQVTLIDKFLS